MIRTRAPRSGTEHSAPPAVTLSTHGRLRRFALLSGMGLTLSMAGAFPVVAHAAQFGSSAWFAQRANAAPATTPDSSPASSSPAAPVSGGAVTPNQASLLAQKSIQNLANAAAAIIAAQNAQNQSAQQALSGPNHLGANLPDVPDGLGTNGLQVAPGVGTDPSLWQNAKLPTQTSSGGQTTVTVQQTAQNAILTWQTFNVGKHTTLSFDQSAGTQANGDNNWIALNRVLDPSANPTQILGSIKAQGSVYLINGNGIIFGGSSLVNTHSFLASSLSLFNDDVATSNNIFLNQGLTGGNSSTPLILGDLNIPASGLPGDISIQKGAQITTGKLGYSLIAAPDVSNAGTITATDGQAILAAGAAVQLDVNSAPVLDATGVFLVPTLVGSVTGGGETPPFDLVNTGLVQAARGNATLLGYSVTQSGVVAVTTSVTRPGSIVIAAEDEEDSAGNPNRVGPLEFTAGSLTANLPDGDGETTTSSTAATQVFQPGTINLTGGSVVFDGQSLVEAPGEKVSVQAIANGTNITDPTSPAYDPAVPGRVYLAPDATIDVSGLSDVELSVADTLVTIPRVGQNELADSPLLRDGFLFGQTVTVDSTLSGTRSDGETWVGSPIVNAAGYIQAVPRTIDQLLTGGGTLKLSGAEVITAKGSLLNLDGGYINYLGGMTQGTTNLLGANGLIYNIGSADPNIQYVGLSGQTSTTYSRWNVTEVSNNPLLSGRAVSYEAGFIQGSAAGSLSIASGNATVLDGGISAQAFAGAHQVASGSRPAGGSFSIGPGTSGNSAYSPSIVLGAGVPGDPLQSFDLGSISPTFDATTSLATPAMLGKSASDPTNLLYWTPLSAQALNAAGFSTVSLTSAGGQVLVQQGANLAVQPGGKVALNAAAVTVLGELSAPAGQININTTGLTVGPTFDQSAVGTAAQQHGDIVIGSGAVLSTRGEWINDAGLSGNAVNGSEYVNGGSITLSTQTQSVATGPNSTGPYVDVTGSIVLQSGSTLDVSSGGYVQPNGQLLSSNGIAQGKGGNISLLTYAGLPFGSEGGAGLPTDQPSSGTVQLGGSLLGEGLSGGGTLTIQALGFQIGGDAAAAPATSLYLSGDFFTKNGFGGYVLDAEYDNTVTAGTTVTVSQQNLIPNYPALSHLQTGADLLGSGLVTAGTLDDYHRPATNLTLSAGGYLAWRTGDGVAPAYNGVSGTVLVDQGAAIKADAGATVELGSAGTVAVLGSITAHGGNIILDGRNAGLVHDLGGAVPVTAPAQSVLLGADSSLDASGVALINPLAAPVNINGQVTVPRTGTVLSGGSVQLYGGDVVAESGSTINVSGASDTFQLPQGKGSAPGGRGGITYASTPVWSNGGQIVLGASDGLFFDGTLQAKAGAAAGDGGSLTVTALGTANAVILLPDGTPDLAPQNWQPGQAIAGATPGTLYFSTGRLDNSGIGALTINSNANPGVVATDPSANQPGVITLGFSGDINLSLAQSFTANAANYMALPAGSMAIVPIADGQSVAGGNVQITAPYVSLQGYYNNQGTNGFTPAAAVGTGTLTVNASFIDINGSFNLQNFGQANFDSSGDIRFYSASNEVFHTSGSDVVPGILYTAGNLEFTAAQLYPASGNTYIIDAAGPAATTIAINGNGASSTPLSAGGSLLIDATNIVQAGTIRAPSGTIVLGVTDPANAATVAQFDNLPLVATQSVTLADGSLTSVSLGNTVVPYGTTLDGQEWQYNPVAGSTAPDLTAPPPKQIAVNGADVTLSKGATLDLSGGGDLQAQEWVPGTGGSRDVLSQYNTSYATNASGSQVPLYADGRAVYAVIPGYSGPVAPYDPVLTQGQGGMAVGQAVYLSGAPGLPAGIYTLLPAKYATLPGAFRVVQNTSSIDSIAAQNTVLPDGTAAVAGYFVDSLTGARSARTTTFDVQSSAVWQQYSQYTLTSANSFFPALAAHAGAVTPLLPKDAGQLILGASGDLELGATLNTAAATGGAPAQVDIASQDIQIVGTGEAALPGYLQLSAGSLDALNAGSLLIGGTRTQTASGVSITPLANSIVVSNDGAAGDVLSGPEIILVTKTDPTQSDPNAATGLQINSGSVISASGAFPAGRDVPISIGVDPDAADNIAGSSGDGALLRVSNGSAVAVTRNDVPGVDGVPGTAQGLLTLQAGSTVNGGQSLTLDSSGSTSVDAAASFSGKSITADSSAITFVDGAVPAGISGFVIGSAALQQFSSAQQVTLRSSGAIDFEGDTNVAISGTLDLSAGTFTSGAYGSTGSVSLSAGTLGLSNELGAASLPSSGGAGTLTLKAGEIDLGSSASLSSSTIGFSGFGSINAQASGGIVTSNGSFVLGDVPLTLSAPVIVAGANSSSSISTDAALTLSSVAGKPLSSAATSLGGALSLSGGSIDDSALIEAPAGDIALRATSGDLNIDAGATVSSAGVSKQFYDVTEYAPAGSIFLVSDHGSVQVAAGATLDFSGASGGGNAGGLNISAPEGGATLAGSLRGGSASGYQGGSFVYNTGAAASLDALAAVLSASGATNLISIQTGQGNLSLSQSSTLAAHSVILNADGGSGGQDPDNGNVQIAGTIDASSSRQGLAGGDIELYGKSGVDVEGSLLASTVDPAQRGGNVTIATSGKDTGQINAQYGNESLGAADSGVITLGPNAVINVSDGSGDGLSGGAGGLGGGTVSIRAPLLSSGDVNVSIDGGTRIVGARDVGLEAYAVWSTTDASSGAQHFDGIIDPAGWYSASGALLPGTFTTQTGAKISYNGSNLSAAQLAQDLAQDYFTPTQANAAHIAFYQTTLAGFVETPGFTFGSRFSGIANFNARPGVELDNPSQAINNGDIDLLSNWNLGAGSGSGSNIQLVYRYGNQAPVLTLRALNNLALDANLSDGFYQTANPFSGGTIDNSISPVAVTEQLANLMPLSLDPANLVGGSSSYRLVAGADFSGADPLSLQDASAFAADGTLAGGGSVTINGHFSFVNKTGNVTLQFPTLVRTGTGFIELAAGNDFALLDTTAPGVLYTAGAPAAAAPVSTSVSVLKPTKLSNSPASDPEMVLTGTVDPTAAGDIHISAQNDIDGIEQLYDTSGKVTGKAGDYVGQFWWPWMEVGKNASQSTINFGSFDQGILSAGGNVQIAAGGDIRDLSVSLPTTWYLSTDPSSGLSVVNTVGGGNLSVSAGGDILSGDYFVAKGYGSIVAGGQIGSDFTYTPLAANSYATPVSTLLALQDAVVQVSARQNVDIGGVYNPSYLYDSNIDNLIGKNSSFDSQSYSARSSLSIASTTGTISFDTLTQPYALFGYGAQVDPQNDNGSAGLILPATLNITALGGGVSIEGAGELYPSATGGLNIVADQSIDLFNGVDEGARSHYFGLIDASASALPSPLNPLANQPYGVDYIDGLDPSQLHQPVALHTGDTQPVRVYSLQGSIVDGTPTDDGFAFEELTLAPAKPALVYAGLDIVNLPFLGQNLTASDVSRVVAGHDIYDTPLTDGGFVTSLVNPYGIIPSLLLSGPGTFDVESGRDIGPLTNQAQAAGSSYLPTGAVPSQTPTGINTIGNQLNPYLPHQSASIQVLFGVGPGIDQADFISRYIDPANAGSVAGVPSFSTDLVSFMQVYQAGLGNTGTLTPAQAWTAFQALPGYQQLRFVDQVFFKILALTGSQFNDPDSPYFHQYARGYDAINTLFPASLGYTANNLTGGANGGTPVQTGNLDIRSSTIQTQQGGDISIFGPGGQALIGSSSAPPSIVNSAGQVVAGPDTQGILTLEQGAINIFTDRSVLLAQSRIFTEQGGDMLIWSSNGDINAGKGAKTSSEIPPPEYVCDPTHYCLVDAKGQVSGAGIATLQTVPGATPGSVALVAPRGTVDAGDAGIRVSGSLFVAAQTVANASNIQVTGSKTGVPVAAHVDTGALAAANAATAAAQQANDLGKGPTDQASSLITVEVLGFGTPSEEQKKRLREKHKSGT